MSAYARSLADGFVLWSEYVSVYVACRTRPVGSNVSPAVYSVFTGGVFIVIESSVEPVSVGCAGVSFSSFLFSFSVFWSFWFVFSCDVFSLSAVVVQSSVVVVQPANANIEIINVMIKNLFIVMLLLILLQIFFKPMLGLKASACRLS